METIFTPLVRWTRLSPGTLFWGLRFKQCITTFTIIIVVCRAKPGETISPFYRWTSADLWSFRIFWVEMRWAASSWENRWVGASVYSSRNKSMARKKYRKVMRRNMGINEGSTLLSPVVKGRGPQPKKWWATSMAKNERKLHCRTDLYRSTPVRQGPRLCFIYVDFRPSFEHSGQVLSHNGR